jgi:hypothetical protein
MLSGHHLPPNPLGHQANGRAHGAQDGVGVTEHWWDHSISLPENRLAEHIRRPLRVRVIRVFLRLFGWLRARARRHSAGRVAPFEQWRVR